jgi:single-strand DNA-binding protein
MNTATIFGNLGKDPEVRTTQGGLTICTFSVADNARVKKGGEWVDEVSWWNVTMFGKKAEWAAEQLHRGQPVTLIGHFKMDSWTDKEGKARQSPSFIAEEFMAGARRERASEYQPQSQGNDASYTPPGEDGGDLPF